MNRRLKLFALAGLCILFVVAALVLIPAPLSGNWISGKGTFNCMCDSHNFIRFEDGKVLLVRSAHPPPEWIGEYRCTGFGTYTVHFWDMDDQVIHSGILALRPIYSWFLFRDPSWLLNRRILATPGQQRAIDSRLHLELLELNGEPRYAIMQRDIPFQKVRRFIERLSKRHDIILTIYTDLTKLPNELQSCLDESKVKYEIKPMKALQRTAHTR